MSTHRAIILVFLAISSFLICRGQDRCACESFEQSLLDRITDTLSDDECKRLIPDIINCIDVDKVKFLGIGYLPPTDSFIPNFILHNQQGINYAYMIELILAKGSIPDKKMTMKKGGAPQSRWEKEAQPYRTYYYCVIVKQVDGKTENQPLTHDDMIRIKDMYQAWWNRNKSKSMTELRKERSEGKCILTKPYIWI
jgi:hypothetical protein